MKPTAVASAAGRVLAPLTPIPSFHPNPFKQEKFLSIKGRSAETFLETRREVLSRCQALEKKVEALAKAGVSSSLQQQQRTDLLPVALAEEVEGINRKVERLELAQGFALTDELLYRLFHMNIQAGAYKAALAHWLERRIMCTVTQRGPPFPLLLLYDMTRVLEDYTRPLLPDSTATVSVHSSTISLLGKSIGLQARESGDCPRRVLQLSVEALRRGSTGAMDVVALTTIAAAAGASSSREGEEPHEGSNGRPHLSLFSSTTSTSTSSVYVRYVLGEFYMPIWRSAEAMGLLFTAISPLRQVCDTDVEDDGGVEDSTSGKSRLAFSELMVDTATQSAEVRKVLMSFTPQCSSSPLGQLQTCDDAMPISGCDPAVLAPLRAVLSIYSALATCAAEAKSRELLLALQVAFCAGFLCRSSSPVDPPVQGDSTSGSGRDALDSTHRSTVEVRLNEHAWCGYCNVGPEMDAARALLATFAQEFLSTVYYALQSIDTDRTLWLTYDIQRYLRAADALAGHYIAAESVEVERQTDDRANVDSRLLEALHVHCTHLREREAGVRDGHKEVGTLVDQCIRQFMLSLDPTRSRIGGGAAAMYVVCASHDAALLDYFYPAGSTAATTSSSSSPPSDSFVLLPGEPELLRAGIAARDRYHTQLGIRGIHHPTDNTERSARESEDRHDAAVWQLWLQSIGEPVSLLDKTSDHCNDERAKRVLEGAVEWLVMATATDLQRALREATEVKQPPSCEEGFGAGEQDSGATYGAEGVQMSEVMAGATENESEGAAEGKDKPLQQQQHRAGCFQPCVLSATGRVTGVGIRVVERVGELLHICTLKATSPSTTSSSSKGEAVLTHAEAPQLLLTPAAATTLAVLLSGCLSQNAVSASSPMEVAALRQLTALLDAIASSSNVLSSSSGGNCLGVLLLMAARASLWTSVQSLLITAQDLDCGVNGLTVDPCILAEVFERARDEGAATVCVLLRTVRERLFF